MDLPQPQGLLLLRHHLRLPYLPVLVVQHRRLLQISQLGTLPSLRHLGRERVGIDQAQGGGVRRRG